MRKVLEAAFEERELLKEGEYRHAFFDMKAARTQTSYWSRRTVTPEQVTIYASIEGG